MTQIGITLVSLALGAIGMITISQLLDPVFENLFDMFGDRSLHKSLIAMAHTVSYAVAFVIISFYTWLRVNWLPRYLHFTKRRL